MNDDAQFLEKLRNAFRAEAEEHVQALSAALLQLESAGGDAPDIVETICREAHTLKGAARAVGLIPVETICQGLESTFSELRKQRCEVSAGQIDLLLTSLDRIRALVDEPPADASPGAGPPADPAPRAAGEVRAPLAPTPRTSSRTGQPLRNPAATTRVKTETLDSVMLLTEELVPATQSLRDLSEALSALETLISDAAKLRRNSGAAEEPRDDDELLSNVRHRLGLIEGMGGAAASKIQRIAGRLLTETREFLMTPATALLGPFPRMVRDIARQSGKEAQFTTRGAEFQIDRSIVDELGDVLLHLIRNAVDHGIEPPEERQRSGKSRSGTVHVSLEPAEGGWMTLSVSDDGRGIDLIRVRDAADRLATLPGADATPVPADDDADLVFVSGVSTSPEITEISGRGLGMAIVREKVGALGGTVEFSTQAGQGTTFSMRLPLVRSSFRGVRVRAADRSFVVPCRHIDRIIRVGAEDLLAVEGSSAVFFEGRPTRTLPLAHALDAADADGRTGPRPALVLSAGAERVVFLVDAVAEEFETIAKEPGPLLRNLPALEAVTVLSSGEVAPVLSVPKLLALARRRLSGGPSLLPRQPDAREPAAAKDVLVADDSITSRMLLKNILEGAGYRVRTVVGGSEAWQALREAPFDAVVTDVEMPGLNGFELTKRVRADSSLQSLPVLLVSALGSAEDKARGMDAGADAYIVKSSFNQSDLLGHLGRLLYEHRSRP